MIIRIIWSKALGFEGQAERQDPSGGTSVLTIDGKTLSQQKMEHTIMALDQSMDVGTDTRTGVDDSYKLPFKFAETINKLTYKIGPEQLTVADRETMQRAVAALDTPTK